MDHNLFRNIILFLLLFGSFQVIAQQGAILKPMELDSIQVEIDDTDLKSQLITGSLIAEPLTLRNSFQSNFPDFNYYENNSLKFDFNSFSNFPINEFSLGNTRTFHSPFFNDAKILSQQAFTFGDKFVFGGFSYGVNSVFSAPNLNQNSTNFDFYGTTLFMQYKVSKNIKIETRINVTNSPGKGF